MQRTSHLVLIFLALLLFSSQTFADDYFIITSTHKTQIEAQKEAALKGGWVLITNFYDRLSRNLFAVVRGPFKDKSSADERLAWLMDGGRYPGSYVKNAGKINISLNTGNKDLSPQMIAMLMGELRIQVTDNKGATNPCEPQEPYKDISLSFITVKRAWDEKNDRDYYKAEEVPLDVGEFRELKSSGKVERMRICAE